MKAMKQQLGAGLVEFMVAMAIGTVIALGAGQLFLSTFVGIANCAKTLGIRYRARKRIAINIVFLAQLFR